LAFRFSFLALGFDAFKAREDFGPFTGQNLRLIETKVPFVLASGHVLVLELIAIRVGI
jgi:hypothetical protein